MCSALGVHHLYVHLLPVVCMCMHAIRVVWDALDQKSADKWSPAEIKYAILELTTGIAVVAEDLRIDPSTMRSIYDLYGNMTKEHGIWQDPRIQN